jgi:hypothetical protein
MTEPAQSSVSPLFSRGSIVVAVLWSALGLLSLQNASWLDTLNAFGLFAGILLGVLIFRGTARMAESSTGRLWTMTLFLLGGLVLAPAFQHGAPEALCVYCHPSFALSMALVASLFVLSRLSKLSPQSSVLGPAVAPIERFFTSAWVRLNLFVFGAILLAVGAQLGHQPLLPLPAEITLLGLALAAAGPLWRLSAERAGIHALLWPMALVLACSTIVGFSRYEKIADLVRESRTKLAENKPAEATAIDAKARELNAQFKAYSLDRLIESDWADYYERIGDFPMAVDRWKRVARLDAVPEAQFVPIQRVMWKMGDSLSVWRKLVYSGFPALTRPEIAQGVLALGERPNADVRARLAAALVAWELKLPADDCRKRLEDVQRASPNEPSSHELLRRLNVKVPDGPLWLPPDLLVGKEPTFHTVTGTVDNGSIEEQGELSSLIVLGEGQWELLLKAHGSPLHEEWPLIRLELNGHEIGRTQVTQTEARDIPFTFVVNRSNVYQFRLVFENYLDELDAGKPARRGLWIGGMTLRRAKD